MQTSNTIEKIIKSNKMQATQYQELKHQRDQSSKDRSLSRKKARNNKMFVREL